MDSSLPDRSPLQGTKWASLPAEGREQLALEVCLAVASAISAGVCIMDTQLRCIKSNAVLAEISALPEAVHAGMRLVDLLPELAGQVEPICQQVFQTGKAVTQVELYIEQAADHRLRAVQQARSWFVSCFPLFHANSCWVGLLIVEDPSPYRSHPSPLPDLGSALAPARFSPNAHSAHSLGAALSQNPEEGMLSQNIQNIMQPQDISSLEKLQQQVERERLINKVAMQILQSNHLNDILQVAVGEVRQFLQADRVIIGRCHLGGQHQVVAESVAAGWSSSLGATLPDAWLKSLLNGEQGVAPETTGDFAALRLPTDLNQWAASQQIKSWLAMPIFLNEQIWGFIAVHQCAGVRQWQSLEIELLEKLTTQLAIAIQQAELHNHIQRLNDDLENQVQARTAELQLAFEFEATLKRITDRVRDSLDEDLILQAAVRELAQVLKISGCNASLYDLEAETSTTCYEYTTSISPYQGRVLKFSSVPELYNQLLKGQYFQFCSLLPNPERGLSSMLACPILDDQGVIGDLWLIHHKYYAFNEQDIRLVQQVANQCAIAIRQARLYEESQAQVKELERLNQLKDDFLSTVSHELRTPLANIKMAIHMLRTAPSSDKRDRYMAILEAECSRETELINDLLDLQKLENDSYTVLLEPIELKTWIPSIVAPFASRAFERQQVLDIDLAPDIPLLLSDRRSLERILAELVNNACKYTPPQGNIRLQVTYFPGDDPESIPVTTFVVSNQATVPPEELPRMFEKFYRIPRSDPWQQGGTGLGLALVKKLVETLQGSISVTSEAGWTHLCVILPLPLKGMAQ